MTTITQKAPVQQEVCPGAGDEDLDPRHDLGPVRDVRGLAAGWLTIRVAYDGRDMELMVISPHP